MNWEDLKQEALRIVREWYSNPANGDMITTDVAVSMGIPDETVCHLLNELIMEGYIEDPKAN